MRLHILVTGSGWADDLTAYAAGASWEHGPTGPRSLTLPVPLTLRRAARLYDAQGEPPAVTVRRGPRTLWAGRVDRAALAISGNGTTLNLRAVGGAAALRDIRHTALWSSRSTTAWEAVNDTQIANRKPALYEMDTNNRLFIGLKEGQTYGNAADAGELGFEIPHLSSRQIVAVSFDYTALLPGTGVSGASWRAQLEVKSSAFVTSSTPWAINGNGATQSSTFTGTFSGGERLGFVIFNNTGAPVGATGNDGAFFLRITNLRVQTTTAATVTAGAVAQALLAEIVAANSNQLSSSTALIEDPGFDFTDLVYEDSHALPILQALAAKGNGAGTIYECGVDTQRRLFFRPRGGAARQWFVRLNDLRLERPRDSVESRVYARYQDANNRTLRTDAVTNAASLARYGLIRDGVVDDDTTSGVQAILVRDTYAADVADPQPAARFGVRAVQRAGGAIVAGDEVLPGDTVTVLGLPGRLAGLDRVRTFRVGESGYDAEGGPTLTPEEPLPSLDVLLAQQGRALDL